MHPGKEKGFTLIEVMVAMVIISISLLAMGALTMSVIRSDNTAKLRTVGMHVAEQQLEKWYATNNAPLQTDTFTVDNVVYQLQSFDATPISGVGTFLLSDSSNSTARSITVYWKDQSGVHHVSATDIRE